MADSIQETPESPSATIDRLSNNVRTLGRQLRDIANILGVDVDEIASAILRERKESETRESAAEDDAQRLRDLVCAEDLGDFVEMSGKRPHEIGRYLIDLWQEDIQGREREKATALAAAVQGEREAIKAHLDSDDFRPANGYDWTDERYEPWIEGVTDAIVYIDSRGPAPAVDVPDTLKERDRLWCDALVSTGDLRLIEKVTAYVVKHRPESIAALVSPATGEAKENER